MIRPVRELLAAVLPLAVLLTANPCRGGEAEWLVVSGPHLDVRYPEERYRPLAEEILRKSRIFLAEARAFLGVFSEGSYSIVIADSEERFRGLQPTFAPAPEWAGALAYPALGMVLVKTPAVMKVEGAHYYSLLHHEMAHLVMGDAEIRGGVNLPRWFGEGVATYVAGEMTLPRLLSLSWAQVTGRAVPFDELRHDFPEDPDLADAAYAQSYLFIKHLTKRFGQDAVARLFSAALREGSLEAGTAVAFGQSMAELMVGFDRYARIRATWIPAVTSTAALWGVLTLLFLYGYWVKRSRSRRTLEAWDEEEAARSFPLDTENESEKRTLH